MGQVEFLSVHWSLKVMKEPGTSESAGVLLLYEAWGGPTERL